MTITPHELMKRMASTMREEIGPAVTEPFAKTQAFMASVILTKLATQLATVEAHAAIESDERRVVGDALRRSVGSDAPDELIAAVNGFCEGGGDPSWNRLVLALYATRVELDAERFSELLGIVRTALRGRLDRALVYAS